MNNMKLRIHKYPLNPRATTTMVTMPVGANILSVVVQDTDLICVYAVVDASTCITEQHKFVIYGTGQDIEPVIATSMKFIGTVNIGPYWFHVFEVPLAWKGR